jgi:hypothetical protein
MANINDIGIPGVGTGILQPKLKNRWRATFAGIGGPGTNGDAQPLSMQVVTMDRPTLSFEEVALNRYNSRAWIAAKHSWEEIKISIEDDITSSASQVLTNQLQAQQYLIGTQGPWLATAPEGSLYKFVTYLDMLDGNEQVLETWTLEGCWLKNVNYNNLDYSASEAVKIDISMRFDHAFQTIGTYTTGPGSALGGAGRVPNGTQNNNQP